MSTFSSFKNCFTIYAVCQGALSCIKMILEIKDALREETMYLPMVRETGVQSQRLKKMVLDATLLNTQYYKVRIKSKVEQSKERSCILLYTSVWYLLKREPSGHPRLRLPTLLYFIIFLDTAVFPFQWNWMSGPTPVSKNILQTNMPSAPNKPIISHIWEIISPHHAIWHTACSQSKPN